MIQRFYIIMLRKLLKWYNAIGLSVIYLLARIYTVQETHERYF